MRTAIYGFAIVITSLSREAFQLKDVEETFNDLKTDIVISYRTKLRLLNYFTKKGLLKKLSRNRYKFAESIKSKIGFNDFITEKKVNIEMKEENGKQ